MQEDHPTNYRVTAHETPERIAKDVFALARIEAVPAMLDTLCEITGMGFAAVARVSDVTWTVCAAADKIGFGLKAGDQLPLESTLCVEGKRSGETIVIDHASLDLRYRDHHTPKIYRIESYISVPIVLPNGNYFGNLCAVDRAPAKVSSPSIVNAFERFALLIARQLASELDYDEQASSRVTHDLRPATVGDLRQALLGPLQAITDATNILDRDSDDPVAVKRLATRIRTNALAISSSIALSSASNDNRDHKPLRSRTVRQSSETLDRSGLESLLMQRVGELNAHFGRFDMYALAIAKWLEAKHIEQPSSQEVLCIRDRGQSIANHMRLLSVPAPAISEFESINAALLATIARQEIAARAQASIPALREPGRRQLGTMSEDRAWFDHVGAPDEVLARAINDMEREISTVVSLYIRLAGWAGQLSILPCWQ